LSIDEMTTFEEEAPHGGTTLFNLHGKATAPSPLPKGFNASLIREELHDLGDQMNCDIDLADDIEELANISVA
jgi:glycine cleavage system regulatory protein